MHRMPAHIAIVLHTINISTKERRTSIATLVTHRLHDIRFHLDLQTRSIVIRPELTRLSPLSVEITTYRVLIASRHAVSSANATRAAPFGYLKRNSR